VIGGNEEMRRLKVHESKKYLMWDDGSPFYYLADTAWELAHKLNKDEMEHYMSVRKEQGFNVLQVVALAEFDGVRTPNAYGHYPFGRKGETFEVGNIEDGKPNFWTDLDAVIQLAQEKDMLIGLLPTWGDKFNQKHGLGPEIFDVDIAYRYGRWLGERYREQWNLIWILGGDRPLETEVHRAIIDSMAAGLREGDNNMHLMTFHPSGAASSVDFVASRDYIDFHSIQSGHGMECYDSWELLRSTRRKEDKPILDMESRYERFPACFQIDYGYEWDASDIRQNNYWNMMEGVLGHTYGHRAVWCFNENKSVENPYFWQEALTENGANEMKYLEKLRLSRPYFEFRNGDELIIGQSSGSGHQCCGRGNNYAFFYTPLGLPIYTDLTSFGNVNFKASWFNPRNGEERSFAFVTSKEKLFVPPSSGKGNDWILILDNM
jgi:hypothetical protein